MKQISRASILHYSCFTIPECHCYFLILLPARFAAPMSSFFWLPRLKIHWPSNPVIRKLHSILPKGEGGSFSRIWKKGKPSTRTWWRRATKDLPRWTNLRVGHMFCVLFHLTRIETYEEFQELVILHFYTKFLSKCLVGRVGIRPGHSMARTSRTWLEERKNRFVLK